MARCVALLIAGILSSPFASRVTAEDATQAVEESNSFYKVVQPVLDEHCVRCHSDTKPAGCLDLTGDRTRLFSMAYDGLMERGMMDVADSVKEASLEPLGSSRAPRIKKHIDGSHYDVKLTKWQRESIEKWIASNLDYFGTGRRGKPLKTDAGDPWAGTWFTGEFMPIYREKCGSCHGKTIGREPYPKRSAWINLCRPKHSRVLLSHLAKGEGGWGIDKTVEDRKPPVFANAEDPVYLAILAAIEAGRRELLANPRPDMPKAKAKGSQDAPDEKS